MELALRHAEKKLSGKQEQSEDSLGCGITVRLISDPFIIPARGASHDGYWGLHRSKHSPKIQRVSTLQERKQKGGELSKS